MINSFLPTLCSNINVLNIIISVVVTLVTLILFYFTQSNSNQNLIKGISVFNLIKFLLI